MAIPTPPTCFPAEIKQRPHDEFARKEREVLPVELNRHAEDAVRHGVGQTRRCHRACGRARPVLGAFMRTVSTGMTSSCSEGPPWWKARSPPALKTPLPSGKHEIEVGVVAERRGSHPNATRRSRSAAPDPAAAVQIDLVAARRVDPHRLVAIRRKEQMAMIGGHDSMLDARRGKLADGSRQVIDDRIHHLPGLEREARLACVVDLLRAHDDDLRALDLLGEPRGLQAEKLVERDVGQLRHARGGEFLARGEVGKKRVVDPRTERAALLDNAEA